MATKREHAFSPVCNFLKATGIVLCLLGISISNTALFKLLFTKSRQPVKKQQPKEPLFILPELGKKLQQSFR